MKPKSIIGEAAAETSWYDWGIMLATYALGVVAFQLGAPLWAAAIVAFSGAMVIGVKHTCRNLGLFNEYDADEQEATMSRTIVSPPKGAPSGVAGPTGRAVLSSKTRP